MMISLRQPGSWTAALVLTACVSTSLLAAEEEPLEKTTHIYKVVDDVKIQADLYRPPAKRACPVVVWIHGGALIVGSRTSVPERLLSLCQQEGYALVSIDYRLAPEVKVPDVIADVKDFFKWLHEDAARKFNLDADRILVSGGSAGGYLTMMTGVCIQPRPKALVAYWGYGDVDGEWYTQPSEFYRQSEPLIDKQVAYAAVGGHVLTGTEPGSDEQAARGRFYRYLRQNGLWTREITGFDPATQTDKLDEFCPVRTLTSDYPPILMVHGTVDTDVPYELSANMAAALKKVGVSHELVTVEGAGHGLSGGDPKLVEDAQQRALDFIRQQLK